MRPTTLLLLLVFAALRPAAAEPQPPADVVDTAVAAGSFGTLVAALRAVDLVDALRADGPFTVFAPTDDAFAGLPGGTVARLLRAENRDRLRAILAYHVVPGRLRAADLRDGVIETLGGVALRVSREGDRVRVGGASVLTADVAARNGVIHVIDGVLSPPDADAERRRAVRETLELAIERGVPLFNSGRADACSDIYEVAARAVLAMAGAALSPKERGALEGALARLPHADGVRDRAWLLRRAMDQVLAALETGPDASGRRKDDPAMKTSTFEPLIEAPLPEGFPAPGPVGEVALKRYPKYRAARAAGGNSFWTLFLHIKKHSIAMTAPVEMGVADEGGELKRQDMAFLYARPTLGRPGPDGRVDVVDIDPLQALSYGIRGPLTDEKTRRARQAIEERLRAESASWRRDGEWRLLGYNSPMVPADRRFWELQLPVARRQAGGGEGADS